MSASVFYSYVLNTTACQDLARSYYQNETERSLGFTSSISQWQLFVMIILLGVFVALVTVAFNLIRKKVYKDKDALEVDFNAGGKMSFGLVASNVVPQAVLAVSLMRSPEFATRHGIAGSFWYAAAVMVQILIFAFLSVQFKMRAPGAKTYLQVIWARFGRPTHVVYIFFTLLGHTALMCTLMLGCVDIVTTLVQGLSVELATLLIAVVMGLYPLMGGLGAMFYVTYFATGTLFVILLIFMGHVLHGPEGSSVFGSADNLYPYVSCGKGPKGNLDGSFVTMSSLLGLRLGGSIMMSNMLFNQALWQKVVAAKPTQAVWGFISAGLVWFAIPFTFGTTIGLTYVALSGQQGEPLLTPLQVKRSYVPVIVAQKLMGETGELLLLLMILMTIISTGTAHIMAVSSIVVYDIFQIHLKPFTKVHDVNTCVLCGSPRGRKATIANRCRCISINSCQICKEDIRTKTNGGRWKREFKCKMHGAYREYNNYLYTIRNWSMLWVTLAIIPLILILNGLNVTQQWFHLASSVSWASLRVPIILSMFWARLNAIGMITGAIGGLILGIGSWLGSAAEQHGGLDNFFATSGTPQSLLPGKAAAFFGGGVICIVMTLITNMKFTEADADETWERTRDLDNPLSPWAELYASDLKLPGTDELDNRPSLAEMRTAFRSAERTAWVVPIAGFIFICIVWPWAMLASEVFDKTTFIHWINVGEAWAIIAAIFIIVVPVVSEVRAIRAELKEHKEVSTFGQLPLPLFHPKHRRKVGANKLKSMFTSKHAVKAPKIKIRKRANGSKTENVSSTRC